MKIKKNLGIDIGTTFLTAYCLEESKIIKRLRHEGKIIDQLKLLKDELDDDVPQSWYEGLGIEGQMEAIMANTVIMLVPIMFIGVIVLGDVILKNRFS